ncbi:MAG TPA: transglycosylase SLT domain-containing protein [Longimicrobiaceae bacterium]|nr:transglycosylase SLT domain-containing protein [Longimicrobiaceae bacterium]
MQRQSILIFVFYSVVIVGTALVTGAASRGGVKVTGARAVATGTASGDTVVVPPGVPSSVPAFLRSGQAWRAARAMRGYLERTPNASPAAVLLAAQAEGEWGGWDRVRGYLEGKDWLGSIQGGAGWYWLGRAQEAGDDLTAALDAYDHYLKLPAVLQSPQRRRVAELRRGLVLMRLGREDEGAAQLKQVRDEVPEIASRLDVLAAEALAPHGDTAAVRRLVAGNDGAGLDQRGRLAMLTAYEKAGDAGTAHALAISYRASTSGSSRAAISLRAGQLSLVLGDSARARQELADALSASPGSSAARQAAELLPKLGRLSPAEMLEVGDVLARHGASRNAAKYYREWLDRGAGSAAERQSVRDRLGRVLFAAGDYGAAITALRPLTRGHDATAAAALYRIGRAEYRQGNHNRALETFRSVARRFPRTDVGAEGLFFVADVEHDRGEIATARRIYREVADDFPGTDRAGLSLMRLGDLAFVAKDYAGAAKVWAEYRTSYPSGQRWLESTYWEGRSEAAGGDTARANELYRAVRDREPLSYYALVASERLHVPYWPVPMKAAPPADSAARARVEEWMGPVDLLREAGLDDEAEAQIDALIRRAGNDPSLLYPLAETLDERGYTVRGIDIGYRLRDRDGLNPRVLRILYPFPYRSMIEAEARERKLDPFLVAALIRQESSFKARIASGVGARGLMQVMPETGENLAGAVGINHWETELLYQPEINVHLGTLFLADQMREYDGSLPSVFAAYNAGPHRVDQWKAFPEYRDPELFTERIPYHETRDYVRILTRNIAIYRGLYGSAAR